MQKKGMKKKGEAWLDCTGAKGLVKNWRTYVYLFQRGSLAGKWVNEIAISHLLQSRTNGSGTKVDLYIMSPDHI